MSVVGIKRFLHGIIYQIKLSILFLQTALDKGYKFKLYSEKNNAQKFDDVVFMYGRNEQYRFLQAKHKLNSETDKITLGKLFSKDSTQPFYLKKYFISFRQIEQEPQYSGKIKDLVICTNIDFGDDIKQRYVKEEKDCREDILNVCGGKCYKFIFDKNSSIVMKLKNAFELNKLADELVKVVFSKEQSLESNLLKNYHVQLVKEVFDKSDIQEGSAACYCKFKDDFIEKSNLSKVAEHLHDIFVAEAFEKEKNVNNLWHIVREKKFVVPSTFGKNTDSTDKNSECTSNEEIKRSLPNDYIKEDEIEKFFEKLIFAVKQPNEKELGTFIQSQIYTRLDGLKDYNQVEIISDHVQEQVLDWLKSPKCGPLTENDDFFKKGEEKVKQVMFSIPDLLYECCIEPKHINFNDGSNTLKNLDEFLVSEDRIFNLISSEKSIILSQLKVYQVKRQSAFYMKILLGLTDLGISEIETLFKNFLLILLCENKYQDCILQDCAHQDCNIRRLYDKLAKCLAKNDNRKIILITQVNGALGNLFKGGDFKNCYRDMPDTTRVEDLDQKYLQETLLKKTIKFQGQDKYLADLIGIEDKRLSSDELTKEEEIQKLENVLKQESLIELVSDENIKVGNELPDFYDDKSPYYDRCHINITRTFSHQIMHRNSLTKCMEKCRKDLFALCSTKEEYLNNIVPKSEIDKVRKFNNENYDENFFNGRFFLLCDPQNNIKDLFKKRNGNDIHWLTNIGNEKFILKYSSRLSSLREFTNTEDSEKSVKDLKESTVIIAGDPGIGKSTVLAMYAKDVGQLSWFIRVNLQNYEVHLEKANFNNLEGVMNFLFTINLEGLESALAKTLLEYHLKHQDRVILLLDGYDEINDCNQKQVIQLLKTLTNTKGKVWLTTRINKQCDVENALGIFSYRLNPFGERQQHDFLKRFWIKNSDKNLDSDQVEQNRINDFTEKLLNEFRELDIMKEGNLVGIVLQARMVAEVFQEECKEYKSENQVNVSSFTINNIFDLYERFIEYQFVSYFKEKLKIDKKSLGKGSQYVLIKSYTEAHECLALKTLFFENQTCEMTDDDVLETCQMFVPDELSAMGLIKNFKNTDIVDFVHRTYAEYFVAKLLVNMFSCRKDSPKYKLAREFLLRNIFLDRNKLIHDFFKHEIQKKNDLESKWNSIQQDCDLLREIKTQGVLELFTVPHAADSDIKIEFQKNSAISEKSLGELEEDVNSRMHRGNTSISYYGGPELIDKLFQCFCRETDIEKLKKTLSFLIEAYGKLTYIPTIDEFQRNGNIHNAMNHYITQAKLLNKTYSVIKIIYEYMNNIKEGSFPNVALTINTFERSSDIQKEKCMEDFMNFLIPKYKYDIEKFANLNYLYCLIDIINPNIIENINSIESNQKKYTEEIIDFLYNVKCENCGKFNDALKHTRYLQSFFINITQHRNIIGYTKSYINKIFEKENTYWLERHGVLISRCLMILTPEMSEAFNSGLRGRSWGVADLYSSCVFNDFIFYVTDTMGTENVVEINKLAFLKMIVYFTKDEKYRKQSSWFCGFDSKRLKIILILIQNMLNEQRKPELEMLESVELFYILKIAGLKLINIVDQELLVLDPASGFKFELSSSYKDQLIKLLGWKYQFGNKFIMPFDKDNEFVKECYDVVKPRKILKRRKSEDNLQRLTKRLKSDIHTKTSSSRVVEFKGK